MDAITYNKLIEIDPLNFTPFSDASTLWSNTTAVGSAVVLKQITGKGILDQAFISTSISDAGAVRITVDGQVVLYSRCGPNDYASGLFDLSTVHIQNASNTYGVISSNGNVYPINTLRQSQYGELGNLTTMRNLLIKGGIPFKESLKIEFVSNTTTSKSVYYTISGKLKTS